MNVERQGDYLLVTDDVSGRVVRIPAVLTVGALNGYVLRQFYDRCLSNPESVAGVSLVSEGPFGMGPREFREMVPLHLWHPRVKEHPTGGGSEIDHVHEKRRVKLIHKAREGTLTAAERALPRT